MSFYIAPYSLFSYIQAFLQVFSLYIYSYIRPFLFFYILPRLQCFYYIYTIETLIIGVFLYIQCFPYSKNNTFLSIHFFYILPRLQCMFYMKSYYRAILYIYRNQTFSPEKYVFYYIYKKDAFSYVFSLYTQDSYQYFSYIQKPFLFFSFPPAHSISV